MGKESSMKVSSRLAGSGTTENTGNDEIHIGDDLQWCLNSIDETIRKKELEDLPELQYKDKQKMGIIWRRVDYRDVSYYLQDAITVTFRPENDEIVKDFTALLDKDRSEHISPQVRLGMLMRLLVAFAAYNGVVNAMERGWVIPRTPADFNTRQWYHNYSSDSWNAIDAYDPRVLSQGVVVANADGTELAFNRNPSVQERIYASRVKKFLAAKHGFVGNQYNGTFTGCQAYLDTITARTLRGMITDPMPNAGADLGDLFVDDESDSSPISRSSNGIDHVINQESLTGLLTDIQGRVGNDLYLSSVFAYNELKSKVVLKSLSHCAGGEKFNYLIKEGFFIRHFRFILD